MTRRALKQWLGWCLLSPAFAAGCQHYGACHFPGVGEVAGASDGSSTPTVVYLYTESPLPEKPITREQLPRMIAQVSSPEYKSSPDHAGHPAPTAVAAASTPAVVQRTQPVPPPEPQEAVRVSVTDVQPIVDAAAGETKETTLPVRVASPGKPQNVVLASTSGMPASVPSLPVQPLPDEQVQQVEALAPPTMVASSSQAAPAQFFDKSGYYGHSEDYTELRGQLLNSRLTKGWRLRYAPIDVTDEYGGSVRFTEDSQVDGYEDGQMVRVRGRLIADGTRIAPYFRVDAIEVVK